MKYALFNDIDVFDELEFRAASFQLEEFRSGDFSSMGAELKKVIKNGSAIALRHVPLVARYAADRAQPYILPPQREFSTTSANAEKLTGWYRRNKVNAFLLEANQRHEAQNSTVIVLIPDAKGEPRLFSFLPGEAHVEWDDGLETRLSHAKALHLRVPVRQEQTSTWFGCMTITPTSWKVTAGSYSRDVYRGGGNPWGVIPAVAVRAGSPPRGFPWPALPADLRTVQIGLIIGLSDLDLTCRFQGAGREVVIGPGAHQAVEGMVVGSNRIMAIDGGDDPLTYQFVNPQPAIAQYIAMLQFTIGLLESFRFATPGALDGITGKAKEADRLPLLQQRFRSETPWRDAEPELAQLIAMFLHLPQPEDVEVDYRYVALPENDLQSAQADILRYAVGRDGVVEQVAREENITQEAAQTRVLDRMKKNRDILVGLLGGDGSAPVPGLDRVAGFLKPILGDASTTAASPTPDPATPAGGAPTDSGNTAETATPPPDEVLAGVQLQQARETAKDYARGELTFDAALAFLVGFLGAEEPYARTFLEGAKPPAEPPKGEMAA